MAYPKFYQDLQIDDFQCTQCQSWRVYVLDRLNIGYYKPRFQLRLHCANHHCEHEWFEDIEALS